MAALLSPLQLYAGYALLQNQGITVVPELPAAINAYTSLPLLGNLIATMNASGSLPASTRLALQTFAGNTGNSCPALADSIVNNTSTAVSSTLANPGMSGIITLTADAYLGNGDVGKFAQIFSGVVSYTQTTNIFINSAVNAENYLGGTFTNMNTLVSGGLTDINLATQAMGDDLYNAGYWIDPSNLDNLGTPLALIQQISRIGGVSPPLIAALVDIGIDENTIIRIADKNLVVSDTVQKLMYYALTTITGADLAEVLQLLGIWTPNINTLADLLNPAVMLPNSYPSLTTPTAGGLRGIYITATPAVPYRSLADEATSREIDRPLACEIRQSDVPVVLPSPNDPVIGTGAIFTVNGNLETTLPPVGFDLERLGIITSPGLAVANKAFANSLLQVTNVYNMTLPQLSAAFLAAETNKDLPDINFQSQVIPQFVTDYYKNSLATGSGPDGTILITDVLGTAVGTNMIDNIGNCVTIINSLYDAGVLNNLITIYDDMLVNVGSNPTILSLITDAQIEISNIIAANATETAALNTAFLSMSTQLTNENTYQELATIDIANVTANSQVSIQGLVFSLPSYGLDTQVGGTAQYLEDIADLVAGRVDTIVLLTNGTAYSDGAANTTGGTGTGLTVNIVTSAGAVTSVTIVNAGIGYTLLDVITIVGGNNLATVQVGTLIPNGQAMVATLREGRSQTGLNITGVGTAANTVPADPETLPPQATLIPSIVSESEARSQIIY